MKRIQLLIFICCFLGACVFKFPNDHKFKQYQTYITDSLKIPETDFRSVQLEIRFWINRDVDIRKTLFVLSLQQNSSHWTFNRYDIDGNKVELISDNILKPTLEWEKRWDTLIKQRFLTLPPDSKIRSRWKSSRGKGIVAMGGIYYVVDLLTKNKKRSYSYTNPEKYLKYYDINVQELVDFTRNLKVLDNEFQFSASLQ